MKQRDKTRLAGLVLIALLQACHQGAPSEPGKVAAAPPRFPSPQPSLAGSNPSESASRVRAIIEQEQIADPLWSDTTAYQALLQEFYEPYGYTLAWFRDSRATPQALQMITALEQAGRHGLRTENYEGPQWHERLRTLQSSLSASSASALAHFDVALTVSAMRYVSHLRTGRVHPRELPPGLATQQESFNAALFLRQHVVDAGDVAKALQALEPPFPEYRRIMQALERYNRLERQYVFAEFPLPAKTIHPGDAYAAMPEVARLLEALGDLPAGSASRAVSETYEEWLVEAVKHFQARHGLDPDGLIGRQTMAALNTPLPRRVSQLRLALERWRWVPREFMQPPIVVNVPEFGLHAYDETLRPVLSLKVVVGRAYRHQTPVFNGELKYVILRPYWNVPFSIQSREIVPQIVNDPQYLVKGNYEITDRYGNVVSTGEVNELILRDLRSGKLLLRQRPGPNNSLGLIKFVFPNDHDVYLHGTPATALFSRTRRDFSHGCIRVEDPVALAAWVLRAQPPWNAETIRAAIAQGKTVRILVEKAPPVLILYITASVTEGGEVLFFEDIYQRDRALEEALARKPL